MSPSTHGLADTSTIVNEDSDVDLTDIRFIPNDDSLSRTELCSGAHTQSFGDITLTEDYSRQKDLSWDASELLDRDSDHSESPYDDHHFFLSDNDSDEEETEAFDPLVQFEHRVAIDDFVPNADSAEDFNPEVNHPDFLISAAPGALLETPVASQTSLDTHNNQVQATPRQVTPGGLGSRPKDPDYDDKVLLEMDRKHVEIDVPIFLDHFLPGPNLTKAQLKRIGDFHELEDVLNRSPQVAESTLYPILVRLKSLFLEPMY